MKADPPLRAYGRNPSRTVVGEIQCIERSVQLGPDPHTRLPDDGRENAGTRPADTSDNVGATRVGRSSVARPRGALICH